MGHASFDTYFLVSFGQGQGIPLLCSLGRVKQFSAVFSKSSRSRKKSNFLDINKKGIYQNQFELRNPVVHFILSCEVWKIEETASVIFKVRS